MMEMLLGIFVINDYIINIQIDLLMPLPFSGCSALQSMTDHMVHSSTVYLNHPNGVMNVVKFWLSSARGYWWYPFVASMTVKYLASLAATVEAKKKKRSVV